MHHRLPPSSPAAASISPTSGSSPLPFLLSLFLSPSDSLTLLALSLSHSHSPQHISWTERLDLPTDAHSSHDCEREMTARMSWRRRGREGEREACGREMTSCWSREDAVSKRDRGRGDLGCEDAIVGAKGEESERRRGESTRTVGVRVVDSVLARQREIERQKKARE